MWGKEGSVGREVQFGSRRVVWVERCSVGEEGAVWVERCGGVGGWWCKPIFVSNPTLVE